MRGHARIPGLAQNVELACGHRCLEHIAHEADLVVVPVIGKAHRLLVERREEHGVGAAGLGEQQRTTEILGREKTALEGCRRGRHLIGAQVLEIDENRAGRAFRNLILRRDHLDVHVDTGDLGALLQNPQVAENDEVRSGAKFFCGDELGSEFRADAGGIAHRERNSGLFGRGR